MCSKYVLVSDSEKIGDRFRIASIEGKPLVVPSYAISRGDMSYVITSKSPYELQVFRFGMTPYMAKAPMDLINARAEGDKNPTNDPHYQGPNQIFLKKAFMKPIQSQRCLVFADAYYDWSAAKKPYLVYLQNKERPFAFAGIYDRWKNPVTGEIFSSFAIITTTANSMLQSLGIKRMPVILSKGEEREWIKETLPLAWVLRMLTPYDAKKMNAYPVSDLVNTYRNNEPSLINPVGAKLQSEEKPVRTINPFGRYEYKKKELPTVSWGESRMKDLKGKSEK